MSAQQCLEFPAQHRFISVFPQICTHFVNGCCHELCPEERITIGNIDSLTAILHASPCCALMCKPSSERVVHSARPSCLLLACRRVGGSVRLEVPARDHRRSHRAAFEAHLRRERLLHHFALPQILYFTNGLFSRLCFHLF